MSKLKHSFWILTYFIHLYHKKEWLLVQLFFSPSSLHSENCILLELKVKWTLCRTKGPLDKAKPSGHLIATVLWQTFVERTLPELELTWIQSLGGNFIGSLFKKKIYVFIGSVVKGDIILCKFFYQPLLSSRLPLTGHILLKENDKPSSTRLHSHWERQIETVRHYFINKLLCAESVVIKLCKLHELLYLKCELCYLIIDLI